MSLRLEKIKTVKELSKEKFLSWAKIPTYKTIAQTIAFLEAVPKSAKFPEVAIVDSGVFLVFWWKGDKHIGVRFSGDKYIEWWADMPRLKIRIECEYALFQGRTIPKEILEIILKF